MWNYPQLDTDVDRPLVENPDAPSDLFGAVLNGAYAGTKPGTERFVDAEWSNNNGTLTGYTNPITEGWAYSSELGRWGNRFDGTGKYIQFAWPAFSLLFNSPVSFSTWINTTVSTSQMAMWGAGETDNNGLFTVRYNRNLSNSTSAGAMQIRMVSRWQSPQNRFDWGTSNNLNLHDGVWHHVAIVADAINGSGNLFIDGRSVSTSVTVSEASTFSSFTNGDMQIAGWLVGGSLLADWNGQLTSNSIYPFALDPALISWLADKANRLYIPDTRQHFYVPLVTGWKPWLRTRQRHRLGAR